MIAFRIAETRHDHGLCVAIRTLVFDVEQGVGIDIEVDANEDVCRHILGLDGIQSFAAARWRGCRPGVAKIERVAVLKPWRGRNLGTGLVQAVISDIKSADAGFETLRLDAQDTTIPFYERLGFVVVSAGFMDANIPHHAMERPISPEKLAPDAITLRTARDSDSDAIRALTREAYSKWIAVTGREPLPMRVDYADAVKKHRFDLLFADNRLAALIETVREGDHLLIVNVAVAPGSQGRGHGKRLIRHAEELAASTGCKGTRLYTNKLFGENLSLYAALGYRVAREEELNGGVAVHMTKPFVAE